MTNNLEFNRIIRKLDDRKFVCKTFYDTRMNRLDMSMKINTVYIKQDIDEVFERLRELFAVQKDEIYVLKRKAQDLELENYKLKKGIKK